MIVSDLSAVHRNGAPGTSADAKPPSITVGFINSNKKDVVLQKYSNFENRKRKTVQLHQSLSPYFITLKNKISEYCKDTLKLKVRWIHCRSPTSGICVKLDNGNMIGKVFCFEDFTKQHS